MRNSSQIMKFINFADDATVHPNEINMNGMYVVHAAKHVRVGDWLLEIDSLNIDNLVIKLLQTKICT